MRLISLELNGFKSFAQKTKIDFMPGMTGIVGPNGSGKSNIVEAIRWVLGEQSAKDLRGDKMVDVIFAGSDTRKALNRAEVSITFDNSDHYLSSDYSEIKITRKLYRSGESQYLINGQECRLKDVLDLFMDSGLGRESFSIISQGRVEAIFNGKPVDRRAVIEEVAGVAKYKKNKTTAEKRLTDTTDNLHRVGDIISELETQLEPLASQSALAKEYQEQKKQYDLLDRTKTVLDIKAYQERKQATNKRQERSQQLTKQYDQQTNQATHHLEAQKQRQGEWLTKKDQLQRDLLNLTEQAAQLTNTLNLSNERSNQQKNSLVQITKQKKQLELQHTEYQSKLAQLENQINEQQTNLNTVQTDLDNLSKMNSQEQISALSKQIDDLQNQQIDQMQELTSIHNQRTYLTKDHDQGNMHQSQVQTELATAKSKLTDLNQKIGDQQTVATDLHQKSQQAKSQLEAEQAQQQRLNQEYAQLQKQWYQALGTVQSLKTRQNGLKSLESEYSGFYQGTRFTLQHRRQFDGLLGPVAELLTVSAKYTTAIETVLGGQLQNLVVDTQQTGKSIIQFLVSHRAGRVTILPIDSLSHYQPNRQIIEHVSQMPGYEGLASELVSINPSQQTILDHLLGNTIIVDQLDHATQLARQTQHRFRIITLDGQLINASGAMTGGANRQKRQGLLSRQHEIKQLTQDISDAQNKVSQLELRVQQYDQAITTNSKTITELQDQLNSQTKLIQTTDGQSQLLIDQQQVIKRQVTALEYEVGQQANSNSSYQKQLATNLANEKQTEQKLADLKEQIATAKQDLATVRKNITSHEQQFQDKRQWIAVATEKLNQVKLQKRQMLQQIKTVNEQLSELSQQDKLSNQTQEQRYQEKMTATKHLNDVRTTQVTTKTDLSKLENDLTALTATITKETTELDRLRGLQRAALDELSDIHAQDVKLATKIDQGLNRLSESYSMTLLEAQQDLSELPLNEINEQIKLLKRGLAEIGPVNIGSIAEYERVNQRYSFLHQQQADLLNAKQQLSDTMQEMDQEVKTRFAESFNQVAIAFSHIFAQMFGGGQAELVLTDPHDLLTTGIDIIAQPPGKKNQQLSLLSGGEKALTAITLLFAILEVRPVPFAILDETEAALDEANVNRFAHYLSTYGTNGPQFIVVTHRKGTMVNANVLYGVTMQESGVSKMVSVSLEDVPV